VLPVVLGSATRLVEYLSEEDKAYRARVALGATTDTYDREGEITPTPSVTMPSRSKVEAALEQFRGEISQLPPMYSAVKMGGKKLYEMARAGAQVELQPRRVTITRLDLESYEPPAVNLFVECSKGTYIRSLAHDLGAALGTGAYLDSLIRTRHGPFTLESAVTLEQLQEAFAEGRGESLLLPPESILKGWEFYIATPEEETMIRQGKSLSLPPPAPGQRPMMAARTRAGYLLAVLYWQADKSIWHPAKVFA
jgi:tRNA pseudouridine55 synthase